MKRREFFGVFGGAVAWPLATRAAARENAPRWRAHEPHADNAEGQARVSRHSCRGCRKRAGPSSRNVRIDLRWGAGDPERYRSYAAELVALAPCLGVDDGPE